MSREVDHRHIGLHGVVRELLQRALHALPVQIGAELHIEARCGEGFRHQARIVQRIVERRDVAIGGVADDECNALGFSLRASGADAQNANGEYGPQYHGHPPILPPEATPRRQQVIMLPNDRLFPG